jgi:glycosyltransferase involved in cell wall biosynthesis
LKITMIGPVYPYKTGLSYYVGLLYKQLIKNHDVTLYSYSMQYPKLLYKKPQKDYEDDVVKVDEARFVLNSANPFSWVSLAKKINKDNPDLVILQWLHPYFAPCYSVLERLLNKNIKIAYNCHNALPHERFPFDKALTKFTLKKADLVIAHSYSDEKTLSELNMGNKIAVNPHPAYNFFKIKDMTKEEGRKLLNLSTENKVLLFFGLVREYKGLKHLLNAMPDIAKKYPEVRLIIAGDFGNGRDKYNEMIENLKIGDFIQIHDGHIPIPDVEKFFAACDLVVLPYESATQSGVIQAAYGFEKPVLATNVGGLPDAVSNMKTGYIVEPLRPDLISEAVSDFFDNNRALQFKQNVIDSAYKFSWERMEKCLLENL